MRGVPNPTLKTECIRLRVEERMSLREIHEVTGAAKGSLSVWLRPHPLTTEEKTKRVRRQHRYAAPKKERGTESQHHKTVTGKDLTKNQKAKIAEAAVLFRATLHQFTVFGSPFDGDRADWIIQAGDHLWKIQVKWASVLQRFGLPSISLRRIPGGRHITRYQKGDFDFIIGYDLFTDTCYVWSWEDVEHLKNSVTVCPEAAERWDKLRV